MPPPQSLTAPKRLQRTGFTAASAPLMKSGLINLTDVLYLCARGDPGFHAGPNLSSLKQGEQKALLVLSYQTRPQSAPSFTLGGAGDEGQGSSYILPNFAICSAWTLHCARFYHAVQQNNPHLP